jgi:hypothetical protein
MSELDALRVRLSSLRTRLLAGEEFSEDMQLFCASLSERLDACLPILAQCEQGAISAQAAREAIRRALA